MSEVGDAQIIQLPVQQNFFFHLYTFFSLASRCSRAEDNSICGFTIKVGWWWNVTWWPWGPPREGEIILSELLVKMTLLSGSGGGQLTCQSLLQQRLHIGDVLQPSHHSHFYLQFFLATKCIDDLPSKVKKKKRDSSVTSNFKIDNTPPPPRALGGKKRPTSLNQLMVWNSRVQMKSLSALERLSIFSTTSKSVRTREQPGVKVTNSFRKTQLIKLARWKWASSPRRPSIASRSPWLCFCSQTLRRRKKGDRQRGETLLWRNETEG